MEFEIIGKAVKAKFDNMSKGQLFTVEVNDRNELVDHYLASFPDGTNPIYKERTEHDCQCCRAFIRNIGGVVSISDTGELETVWDVEVGGFYQEVADAMAAYVKSKDINNVMLNSEKNISVGTSHAQEEDGSVTKWNHFHAVLPNKYVSQDVPSELSKTRSNFNVLKRSLEEITLDAANTVIELIDQDSIYRGSEHKAIVQTFLKLKKLYNNMNEVKDLFCWQESVKLGAASKIRNTAIGSLLLDLSEGKDLEGSVKSFESKVAPTNYKRPKSLITKRMLENAQKKVIELGYESALHRRFANTDDLTINNVLFADRSVKKQLDVFGELAKEVETKPKNLDRVDEVKIDDFIENILPTCTSVEAMVENKHAGNLVSLIAPQDKASKGMFKWDNNFSWAYNGEVADSTLKQRVTELGGRVDGVLRFTHTWNYDGKNQSLMDLHVFMPGSFVQKDYDGKEKHDNYPSGRRVGWNRRSDSTSSGVQDVDFVSPPNKSVPVENITFPDLKKMPEGTYTLRIHNWNNRNVTTSGFKAEVEFAGNIFQYEYPRPLEHKEWVTVAEVTLKDGVFDINHKIPTSTTSKDEWGVQTEAFTKVKMIMNSPNHWDGNDTGNKHWFFMLEDCNRGEDARGFFNEFLDERLTEHRKVFEVLGSRMRAEETDDQLSGIGFSSTQRNHVFLKVTGSFTRTIKVLF
tara:strand:- start:637 stop:2703 length:2067 start_codon:yes stop_codon:yes gene_type:complete